jgi:P4 family phage/plasmid primase-like protien
MNKFKNLKVERHINRLDDIILIETINENKLDKLINSNLLKEDFKYEHLNKVFHNEKTQLLKYKELVKFGEAQVKYNKHKLNPFGRCNPNNSLGLFNIRREIRHTLASEFYVDIDIENCHPYILNQILNANNIENPHLSKYINERNYYLKLVMDKYEIDRDTAKVLFIRLMYGGSYSKWLKEINKNGQEIKEVQDFGEEMIKIQKIITDNNEELKQIIIKNKDINGYKNINGSVSSYYLQEKEVQILEKLFIYACENNYIIDNNAVLCADGLMIKKELYDNKILDEFNKLILDEFDIFLKFTTKEMDLDYTNILDNHLKYELYNKPFNEGELSKYFKTMYSNKFIFVNNILYEYDNIKWNKCDSKYSQLHIFIKNNFYNHLYKYISSLHTKNAEQLTTNINDDDKNRLIAIKDKMDNFSKSLNLLNKTFKNLLVNEILIELTNNTIIFDKNPYFFCFDNQVYDLKHNKFIVPDYGHYITTTCGYKYNDFISTKDNEEFDNLLNTIFTNEYKEVKNYYMIALSTGLYGQQIENLFVCSGGGGNGKSLLNSLMLAAVGNYGYKLPSNVLLQEIKSGANPEIASLHNKRFVLCQEPPENKRICGSTMKELTGDKTINARQLYSGDCQTNLKISFFLECNDTPKLDKVDDAITRRIRKIMFNSKFVDKQTYDKEINKKNLFISNPYYKTSEFQDKFKKVLIIKLFDYWKIFQKNGYKLVEPELILQDTIEYLALSDDIYDWFKNYFENGDIKKDIIRINDDIFPIFSSSDFYNNMTKQNRRDYNAHYFNEKIMKNKFLQEYIKKKGTTFNKKQLDVDCIIGWKKKVVSDRNNIMILNDDI